MGLSVEVPGIGSQVCVLRTFQSEEVTEIKRLLLFMKPEVC